MVDRSPAPRRPLLPMFAMLTAVAVTGCSASGSTGTSAAATPSQVTAAPTTAGSAGTSPSPAAGAAQTIPASAFLVVPADMRRESNKAEGSTAVPELCDRELAAGESVAASAAMMNVYHQPGSTADTVPHGVLYQTIRSYSGDGAAAFMARARDGLADCASYRSGKSTVKVKTKPLSGVADEAMTIDLVRPQLDLPGNPTGGEQTNRVVVMRFGTVITILFDNEYERSSSIPKLVDTFVREAAKAVRAWRG